MLDKANPKPSLAEAGQLLNVQLLKATPNFVMTILLWQQKGHLLWEGWKLGPKEQESIKIYMENIERKAKSCLAFPEISLLCNGAILTNESEHVFAQKS